MTEQDLAAIAYRLSQTTPGPWLVDEEGTYQPQEVGICSAKGDPRLAYTSWDHFVVCFGDEDKPESGHSIALANATFVAHARTDVEALLGEVERLKTELTRTVQASRQAGAESMREAIAIRLRSLWDQGAANVAAVVPVPSSL